jgi:outer membrane protein OmpA-like peptidoglycan-associated protein
MRATVSILLFALACPGGAAFAQQPGAPSSPGDFAKAMQEAPCDNGQERDQDGLCPAAVGTTRGFNLGARAGTPAPAPAARRPRTVVASAARSAPAASLDDLRITFRSGSADMTAEGRMQAKSFAAALLLPQLARRRFEIAGHTDASGSAEHNQALSQARAESVLNYLVANGVDRARLEAKGYGSEGLALPNAPRDPANRRVEARSLN